MKRLITMVVFAMLAIGTTTAQENGHFTFKGIAIDGPVSEFGQQLVADGFVKMNANTYRGKFLRQNCVVSLVADEDYQVWRVAALLPQTETWSTLETSFNGYIDLYTEKYGKPKSISRSFSSYSGDNSWLKMDALSKGECNYIGLWSLPYGSIEVKMVKGSDYQTGAIRIVYTDNANKDAVRKADLADI